MSTEFTTSLRQIAAQVPLGFECRSCGASAYNWLTKIDRYIQTGEVCCANFRDWCKKAEAARTAATDNSLTKPDDMGFPE